MTCLLIRATAALFLLGASCRCDKKGDVDFAPMPPPPEVVGIISVRSPTTTIAEANAIWRKVAPLPIGLGDDMFREMLAAELDIARATLDHVDLSRAFLGVLLDGKRTTGGTENVWIVALPLADEAKFFAALAQTRSEKSAGAYRTFEPKAGGAPLTIITGKKYALVANAPQALDKARGFVLGTLIPTPDSRDIVIRLLLAHAFQEPGEWEAKMDALARMVGGFTGGTNILAKNLDLGRDARELEITLRISAAKLEAEAHLLAKKEGRVRVLVQRSTPASPWGLERLAHGSGGLISDYVDATSRAEWITSMKSNIDQFVAMPSSQRAELAKGLEDLASALEGSVALSLSQSDGDGFELALLGRVTDRTQAKTAAGAVGAKVAEALGSRVVSRGAVHSISFEGLIGMAIRSSLGVPALSLAWGQEDDVLAVVVGSAAVGSLPLLLKRNREPNATSSSTYRATVAEKPGRVGFAYVAPAAAFRAIASFLPRATRDRLRDALTEAEDKEALLLEWGVDRKRESYYWRLGVPVDALLTLKQVLDQGRGTISLPRVP